MTYKQFLEHIYQRHSGNVKLGLDRMLTILVGMDNPEKKLSGFHIAGTNGKGSIAAMLESLSVTYGFKTGLNTSPHLVDYRERIRINKKFITFEELFEIYKKYENVFLENEASFFEITTAIAFYYFFINNVQTSIFEVGLGGRLDGTNPFNADISIISSISYDHTKSLGDTLEKIAYEKAGIIKENQTTILGNISQKAKSVIIDKAKSKNAKIYQYAKNFTAQNRVTSIKGTTFDFVSDILNIESVTTNLIGLHQATNASVAIYSFLKYLQLKNIQIDKEKIKTAMKEVYWPGRMQVLQENPLLILDGAHNSEGILSLTKNLKALFDNQKIFVVLAILRDKNLDEIIKSISSVAYKIYISKNNSTRAAELEIQENIVKKYHTNYEVIPDINKATEKALSKAQTNDVVLVTGSLYTVSEILNNYERSKK